LLCRFLFFPLVVATAIASTAAAARRPPRHHDCRCHQNYHHRRRHHHHPHREDELVEAKQLLDVHKTPSFFAAESLSASEVNIVGTLYKLFFRRLPEPLIPFAQYDMLLRAQASLSDEKILSVAEVGFSD
jgi:hypothetical protein